MTDTTVQLELRDYQIEAHAKIADAESRGVRRQLGVAATGLGKTVIFTALAERRGDRALILAHRDELVSQAVAKVREVWPAIDVGIVKGAQNDVHSHVVVASVQTLARERRLQQLIAPFTDEQRLLGREDPFGLVVIDEAHHAAADSYKRVMTALRCGDEDGPLLLGVTATPDRGDGLGLDKLFDEIVFSYDMLWGIARGYLSDLRGLQVTIDGLDTDRLKVSRGDYEAGAAGRAMEQAGAPTMIVRAWQEHAEPRKTLVFTPTVAMAEHVVAEFVGAGVSAAAVSGETPIDERRRILSAFSEGKIQVVANCAVLTEGYDEPSIECVVIARPTKSRALYVQMIGRGTRRAPGKDDCLVLDVVGASASHSLMTIPSLFGIGKIGRARAIDGSAPLSEIIADEQTEMVRLGTLKAEEVELFRKVRAEGVAWVAVHDDGAACRRYVKSLGKDRADNVLPTVVLAQRVEHEDVWTAGLLMPDGTKRALITNVTMSTAQGVAEDYVRKHAPAGLASVSAAWRSRPPSKAQRDAAKRWHMAVDASWNAGQLSDALERHITRIKAKRR